MCLPEGQAFRGYYVEVSVLILTNNVIKQDRRTQNDFLKA